MGVRLELLIRLVLVIPIGIILGLWSIWLCICLFFQWWIILITGKRNAYFHKQIKKFFEFYVKSYQYLYLLTDKRPILG